MSLWSILAVALVTPRAGAPHGDEALRWWSSAPVSDGCAHLVSPLSGPPLFVRADLQGRVRWAAVVDPDLVGDLLALATLDGGTRWLAAGRTVPGDDGPSGVMYRSDDGGRTWRAVGLPGDVGEVVVLSAQGSAAVAGGNRRLRAEGGFVLHTSDAGTTWRDIGGFVPRFGPVVPGPAEATCGAAALAASGPSTSLPRGAGLHR